MKKLILLFVLLIISACSPTNPTDEPTTQICIVLNMTEVSNDTISVDFNGQHMGDIKFSKGKVELMDSTGSLGKSDWNEGDDKVIVTEVPSSVSPTPYVVITEISRVCDTNYFVQQAMPLTDWQKIEKEKNPKRIL